MIGSEVWLLNISARGLGGRGMPMLLQAGEESIKLGLLIEVGEMVVIPLGLF